MPLQGINLSVECRNVLGTIVVGKALEPKPFQHLRTLLGFALLRVKRDDTPGDKVFAVEEIVGRGEWRG